MRYDDALLQASIGMSKWIDKGRVRLARPLPPPHETQTADTLLRQALGDLGEPDRERG